MFFKRTYEEITKYRYNYRKFIALYEWACKELKISEHNMIISYESFGIQRKKE